MLSDALYGGKGDDTLEGDDDKSSSGGNFIAGDEGIDSIIICSTSNKPDILSISIDDVVTDIC